MNMFSNKTLVVKRLVEKLLTAKPSCLLGQMIILKSNVGCYKCIHTCSSLLTKLYVAKENNYAHSIFESSANYMVAPASKVAVTNTLSKEELARLISQDWENCTYEEIVNHFKQISQYNQSNNVTEPISDTCYDKMCQALISKCKQFNFEQMCNVLHCLSLWTPTESTHSHNFKQVIFKCCAAYAYHTYTYITYKCKLNDN
jgi:hypothetical protein